jgi:hypothetical protein
MTMPVFSGVYRAVSESDLVALIPTQLAMRMAPKVGFDSYLPPMALDPAHNHDLAQAIDGNTFASVVARSHRGNPHAAE